MSKAKATIHVVWAPNVGPLIAYYDPTKAWTHARTILGVDVIQVELRDDLPEVVRDDLEDDMFSDDETPRVDNPRVKTIKMPPLSPDSAEQPLIPRTTTPPRGEPSVVVSRTATIVRAAMPPLPRPPAVEIAVDDLDEPTVLPPPPEGDET